MAGDDKTAAQQEAMKKQMSVGMAGPPGGGAGTVAAGKNKIAEGPADLSSPQGAVQTFLKALEARDADRLSEATARRAPPKLSPRTRTSSARSSKSPSRIPTWTILLKSSKATRSST